MKKLNVKGFKISNADRKALDHYLLITPKQWAQDALKGMINKAIKTIMKDYFQIYKLKQTDTVSAEYSVVIPAIIAMAEFKPYQSSTPPSVSVERKEPANNEIWPEGFDVEDYEYAALKAYYEDPEKMLEWFMENKIFQRKKAFVKEMEPILFTDPTVKTIPAKQDDFINVMTSKPNYKNRKTSDSERILK